MTDTIQFKKHHIEFAHFHLFMAVEFLKEKNTLKLCSIYDSVLKAESLRGKVSAGECVRV